MTDLEKIEKDLEILKYKRAQLDLQISKLSKTKEKYMLENKLYKTDLCEYTGKDLENISIIWEKDGKIKIDNTFDEIKVTENNKICAYIFGEFSYWGIEWSEHENSYIIDSCYSDKGSTINVLGFFDIKD